MGEGGAGGDEVGEGGLDAGTGLGGVAPGSAVDVAWCFLISEGG